MPQFSHFTPFGFLRFSPDKSEAEQYYDAAIKSIGADANFSATSNVRQKLYADAFVKAIATLVVERAANQADPLRVQDLLVPMERERGVYEQNSSGLTVPQRRAMLARLRRLTLDGKFTTIRQALFDYLGDLLVLYRTTKRSELSSSVGHPATFAGTSLANVHQTVIVLTLAIGICNTGRVEVLCDVNTVYGALKDLQPGAVVLFDAGTARAERAIVEVVTTDGFITTVNHPHSQGSIVTTAPFENMSTPKRIHHIVVKPGVSTRPDIMSGINIIMERLVCGSAIWQVENEDQSALGGSGPFYLGVSALGHVPFVRVA